MVPRRAPKLEVALTEHLPGPASVMILQSPIPVQSGPLWAIFVLPKYANGVTLRTMDAPPSLDVPANRPLLSRGIHAFATLDSSSKLALACVAMGWFFMNTLLASLGSLQHGVHFFDMSAIIADPTRIFFGVEAPVHRSLFGFLCLACLLAPLAPHLRTSKVLWLCYALPLALMVVCGVLLYVRTSGDFFADPGPPNSMSGSLMHFANDLVRRGGDMVSRHIAVGAGAYIALLGSSLLASQGIRRFRR